MKSLRQYLANNPDGLREMRVLKGVTQAELATRFKMDQTIFSKHELGLIEDRLAVMEMVDRYIEALGEAVEVYTDDKLRVKR